MKIVDVGVISDKSGVPTSTLRYYEKVGLIQSIARKGLRRQYREEVLSQLALIALGKAAGFSLFEIKGMFDKNGVPILARPKLKGRADSLDIQIHKLIVLRDTLRHVAECKAASHMECPKFQKLLRLTRRIAS